MAEPYPDSIDVGTGDYARRYYRRPGELVVHFERGLSDADISSVSIPGLVEIREREQRFEGFWIARKRWVILGDDDALRQTAIDLAGVAGVVMATPVYAPDDPANSGEAATPLPRELLVRIAPGWLGDVVTSLEQPNIGLDRRAAVSGILPREHHLFVLRDAFEADDGYDVLPEVLSTAGVLQAEHDWLKIETFHQGPADLDYATQRAGNLGAINWEPAWTLTGGIPGAPVVVIDSGFIIDHEDLDQSFASSDSQWLDAEYVWRTDDDMSPAAHAVPPVVTPDGQAFGHGNCVAGIIGAKAGNGLGIAGVAGACKMVPVRVADASSAGQVATALGWAKKPGVSGRVVNLSLTTVATSTVIAAVEEAADADIVICAATGNSGPNDDADVVGFPAQHERVIGVGAVDELLGRHRYPGSNDGELWQSRYGRGLDVVAPGVGIYTTDLPGTDLGFNSTPGKTAAGGIPWFGVAYDPGGDISGNYLYVMGGTSGATPHVAGVASLLLKRYPLLSAAQVKNIIVWSARQLPGYDFQVRDGMTDARAWNPEAGFGMLDAGLALEKAPLLAGLPIPGVLAIDPCVASDVVVLQGYLTRGPVGGAAGEQIWRVFPSDDLGRWTEVREADIVSDKPIGSGARGRRVMVRRGAELRHVTTAIRPARPRRTPRLTR